MICESKRNQKNGKLAAFILYGFLDVGRMVIDRECVEKKAFIKRLINWILLKLNKCGILIEDASSRASGVLRRS